MINLNNELFVKKSKATFKNFVDELDNFRGNMVDIVGQRQKWVKFCSIWTNEVSG